MPEGFQFAGEGEISFEHEPRRKVATFVFLRHADKDGAGELTEAGVGRAHALGASVADTDRLKIFSGTHPRPLGTAKAFLAGVRETGAFEAEIATKAALSSTVLLTDSDVYPPFLHEFVGTRRLLYDICGDDDDKNEMIARLESDTLSAWLRSDYEKPIPGMVTPEHAATKLAALLRAEIEAVSMVRSLDHTTAYNFTHEFHVGALIKFLVGEGALSDTGHIAPMRDVSFDMYVDDYGRKTFEARINGKTYDFNLNQFERFTGKIPEPVVYVGEGGTALATLDTYTFPQNVALVREEAVSVAPDGVVSDRGADIGPLDFSERLDALRKHLREATDTPRPAPEKNPEAVRTIVTNEFPYTVDGVGVLRNAIDREIVLVSAAVPQSAKADFLNSLQHNESFVLQRIRAALIAQKESIQNPGDPLLWKIQNALDVFDSEGAGLFAGALSRRQKEIAGYSRKGELRFQRAAAVAAAADVRTVREVKAARSGSRFGLRAGALAMTILAIGATAQYGRRIYNELATAPIWVAEEVEPVIRAAPVVQAPQQEPTRAPVTFTSLPEVPEDVYGAGFSESVHFSETLRDGSKVEVVNNQLYVNDLFTRPITDIEARALEYDLARGN